VHPVQGSDWKKKLSAQAGSVFQTGKGQEAEDRKEHEGALSQQPDAL
jgi:hypothetical protein